MTADAMIQEVNVELDADRWIKVNFPLGMSAEDLAQLTDTFRSSVAWAASTDPKMHERKTTVRSVLRRWWWRVFG